MEEETSPNPAAEISLPDAIKGLILALLLSILPPAALVSGSQSYQARCIGVISGDTLTVLFPDRQEQVIRLHGVDSPELDQPFGMKAKTYLSQSVQDRMVTIQPVTVDHQGLTLAKVFVGELFLNHAIVAAGYAWQYRQYLSSYQIGVLEKEARKARRGLWLQPNPIPPWQWRLRIAREGNSNGLNQ